MIRKLLIANRGEIAVRIIRACRELGVATVAVYSDADASAQHVRLADEAIRIGPSPSAASYLSVQAILSAAAASGADAIHPGYGFLSENAAFAGACEQAGLIFVGPPSAVIARMGSKIEARRVMQQAGVPVVPGETPDDQSDAGLQRSIERMGLPVLVKASAGGGGKGMRRVREAGEMLDAVQAARREALAAFGDGTLYVERLIERAHHVEAQVFADADGRVVHLFERECSIQRRHQKVLEESRAPSIGDALRRRIAEAGVAAARAANYRNAGTVEFLVDVSSGAFYFLEMNTRLQVEHPVTESLVGVDLVQAQIYVASGSALPWTQEALTARGHAIEARVYAEDPDRGFLPNTGRLLVYREPRVPGVRVDSGFAEGDEISVHYDPLLAKVIALAETRDGAIARLREALRAFAILGVRTNIEYVLRILAHPQFLAGEADTGFLDREASTLGPSSDRSVPAEVRLALEAAATDTQGTERREQWDPWSGDVQTQSPRVVFTERRTEESSQSPRPASATSATSFQGITAPMPGTVLKILVGPGEHVAAGATVAIMEAMKMELPLRTLGAGIVAAVHVQEGQLVQADALLVELK